MPVMKTYVRRPKQACSSTPLSERYNIGQVQKKGSTTKAMNEIAEKTYCNTVVEMDNKTLADANSTAFPEIRGVELTGLPEKTVVEKVVKLTNKTYYTEKNVSVSKGALSKSRVAVNPKKRMMHKENKCIRTVYTTEEMVELERSVMPQAVSKDHVAEIEKAIFEDFHEENFVCAVCDEICRTSQTKLLDVDELPPAFFAELQTPSTKNGVAATLNRRLIQQYDVSPHFPNDHRFKNILLSPRGLQIFDHVPPARETNSSVIVKICICTGCLHPLRRGCIPKFAIANGNWIGQLPTQLRDMTFGSRCLLRPVQSFGRMACFYHGSGTRLTGHVYSNKLNVPMIRAKVPIQPTEVPVRVIVVSPFTSDSTAFARAKIASIKQDYVIEREKIETSLRFFKHVGNHIMSQVEEDIEVIENLPRNDVSVDMFLIDNYESTNKDPENLCNNGNQELHDNTGGPSLSRCNEENDEATFVSSTVTIGAPQTNDKNKYEQVVEVLDNSNTSSGKSHMLYCVLGGV